MSRGRSPSPRPIGDGDAVMDTGDNSKDGKPDARVVIVTNLTRNVAEAHLRAIFSIYGEITKMDLPTYANSGQNRGKAAIEFATTTEAHKAASHMDGGQLDGAVLKVELSDLPIRTRSRSRPRAPRRYTPSRSRSRTRSPSPYRKRRDFRAPRGRPFGRRGMPTTRGPRFRSRSRSRSLSPLPRRGGRLPPRRRSPSYTRGGYGRRRSRSMSYSVRSSRSRTRSLSRSRSRSRSYSSYSRYSRSRSRSRSKSRVRSRSRSYSRSVSRARRTRSPSRGRRSQSHDIRDSRSRSPKV